MYKVNIKGINVILFINSNFKYNDTFCLGHNPQQIVHAIKHLKSHKTPITEP